MSLYSPRKVPLWQPLTFSSFTLFLRFLVSSRPPSSLCATQNAQVSDYIQFRNHSENHSRIQQSLYQNNHLKTSGERINLVWNIIDFNLSWVKTKQRNGIHDFGWWFICSARKQFRWAVSPTCSPFESIYSFRAILWLEFHQMPVYYISSTVCLCSTEIWIFFFFWVLWCEFENKCL